MAGRIQHIATDQLTALAFTVRAPGAQTSESTQDRLALTHVAACDECAARFATLVANADALRDAACASTDEVFDDALLDAQRTRILDRLAHLGQGRPGAGLPAPAA
jgi:anti-sigma factor RsiW